MEWAFASLFGLAGLFFLVSIFEPEATLPLGGRCCSPWHPPASWDHNLVSFLAIGCAVFAGLAYTAIVSRKTIAIGALIIAVAAFVIGGYLLASILSATNPFHLAPPLSPAVGAGTYLILGAGIVCLIVALAALLVSSARAPATRVTNKPSNGGTALD